MQNRSILHIVGDSKFGGASRIIVALCLAAKADGWQVDVLATDSAFQALLAANGIGIVDLPVIWRDIHPLRDFRGYVRLVCWLRAHPYSVVHTHTSKGGFVGRLAARRAGISIVIHTVHGFAFHELSSRAATTLYSMAERLAARYCDRIVTVSEFHREWAIRLRIAEPEKLLAIPNGIPDIPAAGINDRSRARHELGMGDDVVVLMTVGRLSPQKGLEYLLMALPRLRCGVRTYRLCLVGDGPLATDLKRLATETGVADMVTFAGFRSDAAGLLSAADIVVLPSLREGLSISLLEAMAAQKPIVTTEIGSNCEVVRNGETGVLVPPADSRLLAEAIDTLANDPDRAARMAGAARCAYLAHYREDRMTTAYARLYDELSTQRESRQR
jgi:glycosyltransferase involved in cell wall biosynthesis